jgi:hypothetical protein
MAFSRLLPRLLEGYDAQRTQTHRMFFAMALVSEEPGLGDATRLLADLQI